MNGTLDLLAALEDIEVEVTTQVDESTYWQLLGYDHKPTRWRLFLERIGLVKHTQLNLAAGLATSGASGLRKIELAAQDARRWATVDTDQKQATA